MITNCGSSDDLCIHPEKMKLKKPRSVLLGFSIVSSQIFLLGFMTEAMSILVYRTRINQTKAPLNEVKSSGESALNKTF